jgi:hypothetical protein
MNSQPSIKLPLIAREACILVLVGNSSTSEIQASLLAALDGLGDSVKPYVALRPVHSLADLRKEIEAINALVRQYSASAVILFGGALETDVTALALMLLSEGHDVHVIEQQISMSNSSENTTVMARLLQAGVVPVTLRQVLSEWALTEADPTVRKKLAELVTKL